MGELVSLAAYKGAALPPPTAPSHPAKDDLSFMRPRKPRGSGIDYWVVDATSNYGTDCDKGSELAVEFLSYIGEHSTNGNAAILGCIVNSMMERREVREKGRLTGIEIAFLGAVNRYAMVAAKAALLWRAGP